MDFLTFQELFLLEDRISMGFVPRSSSAVSSFVSSKEEILICHIRRMRGSPVQFTFSENTALSTMKFELLCLQNRIAERS